MKKASLFLLAFIVFMQSAKTQSVSITTDGSPADTSAMLDVKSTSKGVLVPRMTKAQRDLIFSPATGVLIYQTGPDSAGFHYYDGAKWTWLPNSAQLDSVGWRTKGNSGLVDSVSFLGNIDDVPINFRVNNTKAGRFDRTRANYFIGRDAGDNTGIGHVAIGDSAGANTNNNFPGIYLGYRSGTRNTGSNNAFAGSWAGDFNTTGSFNAYFGTAAGWEGTTGSANTALGHQTYRHSKAGEGNVAVGFQSQFSNDSGHYNVAMGYQSLYRHRRNNYNTAVGTEAMQFDSSGGLNVAMGWRSLRNNYTGVQNTAIGVGALEADTSGSYNTAVGRSAGFFVDTADYVTAIGYHALAYSGRDHNTAVGAWAGTFNAYSSTLPTQGAENTMLGYATLTGNAYGSQNVAIGYKANAIFEPFTSISGTSPSRNIAIGDSAMYGNRGNDNVGIGYRALGSVNNTNMNGNVAVGSRALMKSMSSYPNTAIGYSSMDSLTTGFANTAVGSYSLTNSKLGFNNTAIGNAAMFEAVGTESNLNSNTAVGNDAMRMARNGSNTAVGAGALRNDTSYLNTAVGAFALNANISGNTNTAVGAYASIFNRKGSSNTALGYAALYEDTSSGANTAVGFWSLVNNRQGIYNTTAGIYSGQNNHSGDFNTYIGAYSNGLQFWPNGTGTGNNNTGLGSYSLYSNIAGHSSVGVGYQAGYHNDTSWNTFLGTRSGYATTKGEKNTFVGDQAGYSNVTGEANTYLGEDAGLTAVGSSNVYIGQGTGSYAKMGDNNTMVGRLGANNAFGTTYNMQRNSTLGAYAGFSFLSSQNNTYLGYTSGSNDTAGLANVGVGYFSLNSLRNGQNNAALGANALLNTTANSNSALGHFAGSVNTSGSNNTYLGASAQPLIGSFSNMTAVGANARVDASNSMVLGSINGINGAIASVKVGIGTTTPDSSFSVADNFLVGSGGTVQYANTTPTMMYMFKSGVANPDRMVISHSTSSSNWGLQYQDAGDQFNFLSGGTNVMAVDLGTSRIGIGNDNPQDLLHVGTTAGATIRIGSAETIEDFGTNLLATNAHFVPVTDNLRSLGSATQRWVDVWAVDGTINTSDAREKKNITELSYGLDALMKLRPVQYQWKSNNNNSMRLGLLAQDVLSVIPEVVKTHQSITDEKTGTKQQVELSRYGIYYNDLVPVSIKAIQEQQTIIDNQQKQLDEQKKLIDELMKRLEKLEKVR